MAIASRLPSINLQLARRVEDFCDAGLKAYQSVVLTALSAINSGIDLVTLGTSNYARYAARETARELNYSVANIYIHLLCLLNPKARVAPLCKKEDFALARGRIPYLDTTCPMKIFTIKQQEMMDAFNNSNWFDRNITARLAAPLSALAAIVMSAAFTALALLDVVLSIAALGTCRYLNTNAAHQLLTPGFMLNQLHQGILGIVRPALLSTLPLENRVSFLHWTVELSCESVVVAALAIIHSLADLATLGTINEVRHLARDIAADLDIKIVTVCMGPMRSMNSSTAFVSFPPDETELPMGRIRLGDTPPALRPYCKWQQELLNSFNTSNWFDRHITARLAAPLSAAAMIVTAAVYTVIGAGATVGATLKRGTDTALNTLARDNLRTPGFMLNQLHQGILGFFRPELV